MNNCIFSINYVIYSELNSEKTQSTKKRLPQSCACPLSIEGLREGKHSDHSAMHRTLGSSCSKCHGRCSAAGH